MPSGARLAFATSHRLAPHAETDVPAARLIELLTEAEPHAVLGTCVPPGTLGLLVRPLGAAAASAPAWFLSAIDVFFFAPADPLTPIPSDRFLMLQTIVSLPAAVPRHCPSVLFSFRLSASVLTGKFGLPDYAARPFRSCGPFRFLRPSGYRTFRAYRSRGPFSILRSKMFVPFEHPAPGKKEMAPRGDPFVNHQLPLCYG